MITSEQIENAIYDLCVEANTTLCDDVFTKILEAYNSEQNPDARQALQLILKNAKMAYEKKMPLCQDTGQVLVFVKGRCFPNGFTKAINNGVSRAYEENFYRKSIVKNALFDRTNTKTNTPCIIYTEIIDEDIMELELLIKGAGTENVSAMSMLSPTATEDEIVDFVVASVKKADAKACPPYFIGIGIGGTAEYSGILSKKALLLDSNEIASVDDNHDTQQSLSRNDVERHKQLAKKIKTAVNKLGIGAAGLGGGATALDVKILTDFTHIACMPVSVNINCHSSRHAKRALGEEKEKREKEKEVANYTPEEECFENFLQINTSEIEKLKALKSGQKVLLSGEIYTARDMAHKRLVDMIEKGEKLPFDLKDKIIFYAGPCPACKNPELGCVVGSIGPTTSSRMDKFASILYKNGVLATIGKGERSEEIKITANQVGGLYFTVIGGIACYLSEKFIKEELVAFEGLGTEAIRKFIVKDFPLRLSFN